MGNSLCKFFINIENAKEFSLQMMGVMLYFINERKRNLGISALQSRTPRVSRFRETGSVDRYAIPDMRDQVRILEMQAWNPGKTVILTPWHSRGNATVVGALENLRKASNLF